VKILVTAGNTQTAIDRVRCITNVFSGRTGAQIAAEAFERGHAVTLLTSHPKVLVGVPAVRPRRTPDWRVLPYRRFEELETLMAASVKNGGYDALIHAAAVSDYQVAGIYAVGIGTRFDLDAMIWAADDSPRLVDATSGKVKSHHPELWLRLQPAPKLVDQVRSAWGFRGILVKFKLEVGVTDAELLDIADRSRKQSEADLMVANTLEGMHDWAFLGAGDGGYQRVPRGELAQHVISAVCQTRACHRVAVNFDRHTLAGAVPSACYLSRCGNTSVVQAADGALPPASLDVFRGLHPGQERAGETP
jgi:phosphopantothenate-cysteine ligase/phosphopantothenoylcysteine decarboxylase/phosphopantothenate--cysteine ligase